MSTTTQVIIGFRVNLRNFLSTVEVKSCDHDAGSAKFCPECGVKVSTRTETLWNEYTDVLDKILDKDLPKTMVSQVVHGTKDSHLYIGVGPRSQRGDVQEMVLPDVSYVRNMVQQVLAPVEALIELEEVKLWVVNT
jgi:hypothetical protein